MDFSNVYFLGIGGIGMSALARYFMHEGKAVAGYDRTETRLTRELEAEGAAVHYEDDLALIGDRFKNPADTLVIYTPALPDNHAELTYFRENGFTVLKRSEALRQITDGKYVMAVAGTHGKTTTSTMAAWINHVAGGGGSSFLGGISKNFGSNLVLGAGDRMVAEADEFARSFLNLFPNTAVITSADADHLDVYGTHAELKKTFGQFVGQIKEGGTLILHKGVDIPVPNPFIDIYEYSYDEKTDFYARNISVNADGTYNFDLVCPDRVITGCRLGIPGRINVENAIAATALVWPAGFDDDLLRKALTEFRGVERRFDFHINTPELIYMDDYAHHPEELRAAISSVREMFPGRRITAIFQPHLYTRTKDFYEGFAESLSLADEVILVPIYPAREEPIEGVSSEMIGRLVTAPHRIVPLEKIAEEAATANPDILITFGAGDIDKYRGEIARMLNEKLS